MPERLRELLNKIKEWWNNFTSRQKGIIIGLAVFTVAVFGIIIFFVSRPKYKVLITATSTKDASDIIAILDENSIAHTESQDALTISVETAQYTAAELALGSSGYKPEEYSLEDALTSNLSTTTSDTAKRYQLYLENKLKTVIKGIEGVDDCKVNLNIPEDTGTLISNEEEASAYIQIEHDGSFTATKAANLAKAVQTFLGNSNTANITILDSDGQLLFAGGDDYSSAGIANSMQELRNQAEAMIANQVKKVLLGTKLYDNIEVASNLVFDFSNEETVEHNYTPAEDQTQGVLSHESLYSAENVNGVSGIPGTDTNADDETTYVTQDDTNSSSSITEEERDYLPNEKITTTTNIPGSIKYDESSISVTTINYVVLKEENYDSAANDNMTWNEYKVANTEPTVMQVPDDMINVVSKATGIAVENVAMAAYTQYVFFDSSASKISITDILQIITILVILGLLAFIVIRSMWTKKVVEEEPEPEELSVEQLLESQPEEVLEDIEMDTGSETKRLIEKFVDENPEAAATLLRNWLNEDYGL